MSVKFSGEIGPGCVRCGVEKQILRFAQDDKLDEKVSSVNILDRAQGWQKAGAFRSEAPRQAICGVVARLRPGFHR